MAHAAELHYSQHFFEAEPHYHAALALAPTAGGEAYYRLARIWQHRSNDTADPVRRAIASLRQAVALEPRHDGAYHRLGLLLQASGAAEAAEAARAEAEAARAGAEAAEARRSFEQLFSHDGARRLLAPRLWAAADLAHHLRCAGVAGVSSGTASGDACGALLVSTEPLPPRELLRRCGVAVREASAEGAAAAVARLLQLLAERAGAARELLGPTGANCLAVAGRDGSSRLASAWFDRGRGGVLRCLRYASLVLSTSLCDEVARTTALRWLMMALASVDEPGAARWLSLRAMALRLFGQPEQSARVGLYGAC